VLAEQRRRFLPEVREFITTTVTERERKSIKLQWPGLCSSPGARHPLSCLLAFSPSIKSCQTKGEIELETKVGTLLQGDLIAVTREIIDF
jgi:hypothetical protein